MGDGYRHLEILSKNKQTKNFHCTDMILATGKFATVDSGFDSCKSSITK